MCSGGPACRWPAGATAAAAAISLRAVGSDCRTCRATEFGGLIFGPGRSCLITGIFTRLSALLSTPATALLSLLSMLITLLDCDPAGIFASSQGGADAAAVPSG